MSFDREARIRERAHAIWLEEAQPDGRHEDHWYRAAQEFAQEEPAPDPPRRLVRRPAPRKAAASRLAPRGERTRREGIGR